MTSEARQFDRNYGMDWLRIGAFAILILYHVGMFYVTWDWHAKSPRASATLEPAMLLINPWRLNLLFLISGFATAAMASRMKPGALARSRIHRLFWPLLFGIFVIVPPQSYHEVLEALGPGAVDNFWWRYATAQGNWCDADGCLITPTWNHLWFVAYLLVYSLLLAILLALKPAIGETIARPFRAPAAFLLLPLLWLAATRIFIKPHFDDTHALVDDWYLHSIYFPLFLLGFALAHRPEILGTARRFAWPALAVAVACWAGLLLVIEALGDADPSPPALAAIRLLREAQSWSAIVGLLGVATRHWNRDHRWRAPLTEAVFPAYIVHQTIIILVAVPLATLLLPLPAEMLLLVCITYCGALLAWQIASRFRWLRPVMGMKPKAAISPAA
jgi:glucans biosynthesis protein C